VSLDEKIRSCLTLPPLPGPPSGDTQNHPGRLRSQMIERRPPFEKIFRIAHSSKPMDTAAVSIALHPGPL
jgi:hypothetical protein